MFKVLKTSGGADEVNVSRNGIPTNVDKPATATRGGEFRDLRLIGIVLNFVFLCHREGKVRFFIQYCVKQ